MKNLKRAFALTFASLILFSSFSFTYFTAEVSSKSGLNNENEHYCVLLGEFENSIPIKEAKIIGEIDGAKGISMENGTYRFFSPLFNTEEEVNAAMITYNDLGLVKIEKMVAINGVFYTMQEFAKF